MLIYQPATEVRKLKNLKHLYTDDNEVDSTLLSSLQQLQEIHLTDHRNVLSIFDQKQRYGRANLKIFLSGLLLNGPNDVESIDDSDESYLRRLAANPTRLADEIPLLSKLVYSSIEAVAPELATNLLSRFIDLDGIYAEAPVQDIERFLNFLKNCDHIATLNFHRCDQPQELFDRLPEYCAVQWLDITQENLDFRFICRLASLISFDIAGSLDAESVRKVLQEFKFFSYSEFKYLGVEVKINIDHSKSPKQFQVLVAGKLDKAVSDANAAVQFIIENAR